MKKLYKDIIEWCLSFKSGEQASKEVTLKLTKAKDELIYLNMIKLPDIDDMEDLGGGYYSIWIKSSGSSRYERFDSTTGIINLASKHPGSETQYNKGFKAGQRYEAMERFNNPEEN